MEDPWTPLDHEHLWPIFVRVVDVGPFREGRFCGTSFLVLDPGRSILLWTLEVDFTLWTLVVGCILDLGGQFHFGP